MKKSTHTNSLNSRPLGDWNQVNDPGFDPEEAAEYGRKKSIEKAHDLATVERYIRLVWYLEREGRITVEVVKLTNDVVATVRCALDFPAIKWDGACYLSGQAKPENYEAL